MNTLAQPLVWIPLFGFLLAILATFAAFKSRGGAKRAVLVSIAALCVLAPGYLLAAVFAPHWIDARHRVYHALFEELEIGMTRDEVLAAVEKHYPADGPRQRPTVMRDTTEALGFFMNPEHSREPNCEGIFLDFIENRVSRKRYSRD